MKPVSLILIAVLSVSLLPGLFAAPYDHSGTHNICSIIMIIMCMHEEGMKVLWCSIVYGQLEFKTIIYSLVAMQAFPYINFSMFHMSWVQQKYYENIEQTGRWLTDMHDNNSIGRPHKNATMSLFFCSLRPPLNLTDTNMVALAQKVVIDYCGLFSCTPFGCGPWPPPEGIGKSSNVSCCMVVYYSYKKNFLMF